VRVTVRVPATSANLGPGFDCFGLALDLCNEVIVDTDAEPGITWEGEGADELPTDGSDMVSRAIAFVADPVRAQRTANETPPAFSMHGVNRIPLERGLGSSAAAAVAGTAIRYALAGAPAADAAEASFDDAAVLEGHADNAAAAAFGGIIIVANDTIRRLDPHPDLHPVVLVPGELRLPTADARRALPQKVDRRDAVFNIGHAALAVVALREGDLDLLLVALHDRLHEDVRASSVPETAAILDDLRRRQIAACLSGAGPSILAFERDGDPVGDPPDGWRALRPGIRAAGVEVDVAG
jgi:homoserine kinase